MIKKISFHIRLILHHPKKSRLILGYFLLATGLSRLYKIKRENYRIHFSRNVLALNSFVDPKSRCEEELLLKKFLKDGDTYVDVGANIGTLCIAASKNIKDLKIFAFEANPRTYQILQKNLKLNHIKAAQTYQFALGEKDHEIIFSNKGSDDQNGIVSGSDRQKKTVVVEMKRLDHILVLPEIALLKIDVEGYELFVLNGALKNLENCSAIYIEYSPVNAAKYNYHPIEIIKLLTDFGFDTFVPKIDEEHILLESFLDEHREMELNLIAVQKKHPLIARGIRPDELILI